LYNTELDEAVSKHLRWLWRYYCDKLLNGLRKTTKSQS